MDGYSLESIGTFLKNKLDSYSVRPEVYTYGTVARVGDGVVRVTGLPGRCYGELLEFENGVFGMCLELEENGVGAVLLNTADTVSVGSMVRGTGEVCRVPVGECLLGRVIDPIGRALDGKELNASEYSPLERPSEPLVNRSPVKRPLETGIISIDSLIPIGRGQRELIIGDRQTGKTSIAIDTVLNQKNSGVICIYCAIGQKASTVAQIIQQLTEKGAMSYSIVVAATASDSPAMQYLSAYAACSVGEYFMYSGRDVLVVYDDLSKHAVAYRTMSLLLHRSPGREAYPGDVFYLHSRLLERSACLSAEKGGGSLTALPIIETADGNFSAYIPTNVISITDGQIYLESELFHNGIRPAVNTGLSVSRVGRAAQPEAMKKVSSSLRIELTRYHEMAVFARFGADIDASTKKMLESGEKLTALFSQPRAKCYKLSEKVILLTAYRSDGFSEVTTAEVHKAADELIKKVNARFGTAIDDIDQSGGISDELLSQIKEYILQVKTELV